MVHLWDVQFPFLPLESIQSHSPSLYIFRRNPQSARFGVLRLPVDITPQWLQSTDRWNLQPNDPSTGCLVFSFAVKIDLKPSPRTVHFVQETSPNFLRRSTRVDNTANNADITQSQAANHHRLLSHVTLGLVERRN